MYVESRVLLLIPKCECVCGGWGRLCVYMCVCVCVCVEVCGRTWGVYMGEYGLNGARAVSVLACMRCEVE